MFDCVGIPIFGSLQGPAQRQAVHSHAIFGTHQRLPNFRDQYNALKKKKRQKVAVVDDGDVLKRPRGRTNSKAYEKRDASSIVLQGTLETMMSQKELQLERKSRGKVEQMKIYLDLQQMKIYLDLQTKKLDMEEAMKRRKLDIEEAAHGKKLEIESTIADTKDKEVALALMSVDKNNMSLVRKALVHEPVEGDVRPRQPALGETSAVMVAMADLFEGWLLCRPLALLPATKLVHFEGWLVCRPLALLSAPKTCPF
ncbi:Receptor-like protein kinase HSL1 [Hordeum vulgare]|nr:Receptor-like protein kinase HSL1 [Hordeum vulgare]